MPGDFKYEFDPNFNHVIEEKANTYISLRRVKWGESPEFKVDIRKYRAQENGEQMLKGCTFMSEDGVHELTRVLLEEGYGRTDEIVNTIKETRPKLYAAFVQDIKDIPMNKAKDMVEKELGNEDQYYDMREVI